MPSPFESFFNRFAGGAASRAPFGAAKPQPAPQQISGPQGSTANPAFQNPLAVGGPAPYSPEQEAKEQMGNPFLNPDVRTQPQGPTQQGQRVPQGIQMGTRRGGVPSYGQPAVPPRPPSQGQPGNVQIPGNLTGGGPLQTVGLGATGGPGVAQNPSEIQGPGLIGRVPSTAASETQGRVPGLQGQNLFGRRQRGGGNPFARMFSGGRFKSPFARVGAGNAGGNFRGNRRAARGGVGEVQPQTADSFLSRQILG